MYFTWIEETLKLIELWGEDTVQAQINGCKRNAQVFEKIAEEMKEEGHEKSAIQCREKIYAVSTGKILTRRVKPAKAISPGSTSRYWILFLGIDLQLVLDL